MKVLDLNNETIGRVAGGPSTTTISKLLNLKASSISPETYRKLDKSLRWRPGSARHVARGGDPVELPSEWDLPAVIAEVEGANLSAPTRKLLIRLLRSEGQGVRSA